MTQALLLEAQSPSQNGYLFGGMILLIVALVIIQNVMKRNKQKRESS
jgi:hypothetical protein